MPEIQAPRKFGAIILAAGASSRLGSPKQLIEISGESLVHRAAAAALASDARPVAVVVGANADRVLSAVADLTVIGVPNPGWSEGIASSIRAGLSALLAAEPALDGVLIVPCDQPGFSPQIVAALAALWRGTGRIAASRYKERNGAPALFGSEYFPQLEKLRGDRGAAELLNADPDLVAALNLPALGEDIDTPGDLERWESPPA